MKITFPNNVPTGEWTYYDQENKRTVQKILALLQLGTPIQLQSKDHWNCEILYYGSAYINIIYPAAYNSLYVLGIAYNKNEDTAYTHRSYKL